MRLPQSAGFLSLCAGAGRARSKAHPSSNGFGCAAIFNALTVPPQAGFRICAKSLLGIDPANCRVASSDRLALAHGSLALRVSANLSDHSLSTAVLARLTRSCPSRRLRRTAEMGRVGMWRGGVRSGISVAAPFVWRCLNGLTIAPFPHPPHRTWRANFPHHALGQDVTLSSTARRAQAGSGVRARSARRGARVDKFRPCSA